MSSMAVSTPRPTYPDPRKRDLVRAGAMTAFALVVLLFVFVEPTSAFGLFLALNGILATVLVVGVSLDIRMRGRFDPLTPPAVLSASSLLYFGIAGLSLFSNPLAVDPRLGSYYWVNLAMAVAVVGNAALWAGYLFSGRWHQRLREGVGARRGETALRLDVVCVLFAASVLAHLYAIGTGRFAYLGSAGSVSSGLSQPLYYAMEFGTYAVLLLGWQVFKGKAVGLAHYLFYVMLVTQLGFAVLSGMKQQVVELIAALALAYFYARGRLPLRLVLAGVLLVIVIYPANLAYRSLVRSGEVQTTSIVDAAGAMAQAVEQTWFQQSVSSSLSQTAQQAQGRQAGLLQDIGLIVRYTPNPYSYRHGYDYIALPARILIPRIIWSDKPVGQLGYIMSRYYEALPEHYARLTSTATTQFGDLYLNFGWPGVIVGMALLGLLAGLLYSWIGPDRSDSRLLLYFVVFMVAANVEPDITGMMQTIFQGLLVAVVVSWLTHLQRGGRPLARLPLPPRAAGGKR